MARNAARFQKRSEPRSWRCVGLIGLCARSAQALGTAIGSRSDSFNVRNAIWHHLPQIAYTNDQVGSRHALHDKRQERYCRSRFGAPPRRQMEHRLTHQAEAYGSDEATHFHLLACRRCTYRRCLSSTKKAGKKRLRGLQQYPSSGRASADWSARNCAAPRHESRKGVSADISAIATGLVFIGRVRG
jgi:hypothetical protein